MKKLVLLSCLIPLSLSAFADGKFDDFSEFYERFRNDPSTVMNEHLDKKIIQRPIQHTEDVVKIPNAQVNLLDAKGDTREKVCGEKGCEAGMAIMNRNDLPENVTDVPKSQMAMTLYQIYRRGLHSAKLDETPWSDDYWAIYKGVLGARYADYSFMDNGSDWGASLRYVIQPLQELLKIWQGKQAKDVDLLSPSEKYDLLLGAEGVSRYNRVFDRAARWSEGGYPKGYLTTHQWVQGQNYWNQNSSKPRDERVETWMGICHGWAPAAYTMPRPKKAIQVKAADGVTDITFYPSDLKSLASYYWATKRVPTQFVGGRCNTKEPKQDENGRIIDTRCFDTNPATWHLSVVNQIGVKKRSLVIDATYDYEVWNQPVYSYEYEYFDVVSGERSTDWRKVRREVSDPEFQAADKFGKYRNQGDGRKTKTKWVVGVVMDTQYVVETHPTQATTDSAENDAVNEVRYTYDLQVDSRGEPIGGEWYTNTHPDFIWNVPETVVTQKQYYTNADARLARSRTQWDTSKALPASWRRTGKSQAVNQKLPLAIVLDKLFEKAQ